MAAPPGAPVKGGFRIRAIEAEDLPEVKEVFEAGMRLYCDPLPDDTSVLKPFWLNYIQESLEADLSHIDDVYVQPGGNFFVAEDLQAPVNAAGRPPVVGCVACEKLDARTCELRRMSVAVRFRKEGLGASAALPRRMFALQPV
jgi:hypothetical protein